MLFKHTPQLTTTERTLVANLQNHLHLLSQERKFHDFDLATQSRVLRLEKNLDLFLKRDEAIKKMMKNIIPNIFFNMFHFMKKIIFVF